MKFLKTFENLIFEGMQVYHGSDRKFDEFDLSKIGSGDGKSTGGWGIYFSDSEEVSQRYYTTNGFVREHEIKNGKYFDLDEVITDGERIKNALNKRDIEEDLIEEFQRDFLDYGDVSNKQFYDWLAYILGGEKEASLFLKDLGYIGNTFMDKWTKDARNYVLFDTIYIMN
jgi:hypothetical protein